MINEISAKDGNFYTYNGEMELVTKNGSIVPWSEYEPVFTRDGRDSGGLPPVFIGILDKMNHRMISVNGNVNNITNIDSIK